MVNYKFCPMCSYQLSSNDKKNPDFESFEDSKPQKKNDVEEDIDSQVVKVVKYKKKLSQKQIDSLAASRIKMAEKRAEAKRLKALDNGDDITQKEVKKIEKENEVADEKRKEKNKEAVQNNTPSTFRRNLFA